MGRLVTTMFVHALKIQNVLVLRPAKMENVKNELATTLPVVQMQHVKYQIMMLAANVIQGTMLLLHQRMDVVRTSSH